MNRLRPPARTSAIALALAAVCAASFVSLAAASGGWFVGTGSDVLIVDDGGDAQYRSIQAAVDDADDGDTVKVRPGVYSEAVVVDANVTVVAPRGARLVNGTDDSALGGNATAISIPEDSNVEPTIDGFTIVDYRVGLDATQTHGAWTIRNVTTRNVGWGIYAPRSSGKFRVENVTAAELTFRHTTGDWQIQNVVVCGPYSEIDVDYSTGDWTISDTVIRDCNKPDDPTTGITAYNTKGDWTIRNTTIQHRTAVGVQIVGSTGDWTIRNSTFRENTVGVNAYDTSGDWRIHGTTFVNTTPSDRYGLMDPNLREGTAINARGTNGSWSVTDSAFANNAYPVIATGALQRGDATGNWWGSPNGSDDDDCTGNVDCGDSLTTQPAGAPTGTNAYEEPSLANGTRLASDELTFRAAPGRAVRGESNLPPGTKLTIHVRVENGFISTRSATVDEHGEFRATFDFSDVPVDAASRVTVRGNDTTLVTATGDVIPCDDECPSSTPREPNATLQHRNESLSLEAGPGQSVRGESNLPPGTELSVRVSSEGTASYTMTQSATVDERGEFRTVFDLSNVPAGTDVRAVVHRSGTRLTNVTATVAQCEGDCEPPSSNGDDTDESAAKYPPNTVEPTDKSGILPFSGLGALSVGGLLAVVGVALLTGTVRR